MAEIEKDPVGFPVMCHLVAREFTEGGSTLFFYLFTLFGCIKEIIQSCDRLGCRALALPSPKQIVPPKANTPSKI